MARANAAFATPSAKAIPTDCASPVDLAWLATEYHGNSEAELDALKGFSRQARSCLQVLGSGDLQEIRRASDLLGAMAGNLGARRICAASERLSGEGVTAESIALLGASIVETENFILKLCR
ncbi:Hpt domain-containing protein [Rhizobium halophytocola]|uniref:Hpt domain-containing protein n=1 Tax=Rhizobium halophytocola TaxID=735519 RepID=A0ABS4DZ68_9HYPH|nr:Hpt domain-containing protein [Rhizobium halophytocola]MBP1850989.1 hypothetical protein [Rhizobium halophytocola]